MNNDRINGAEPSDEIAEALLQMGRVASTRLDDAHLSRFRENVLSTIEKLGRRRYFDEWLAIIDNGRDAVAAILNDESERGVLMRSVVSLRPFVSKEERDAILQRVYRSRFPG